MKDKWNNWCWKTPDHWSSSSPCSRTPQAGTQYPWMGHWERHSLWSNQSNPPVDITINDPRQCGDGRGEVTPTFDGTNFRQHKRRVRLFASNTQVASEKRAGKLLERLEERAFESCEGIQDLETPNGVEKLLDHLRIWFEPIEVFGRERVVDDSVCNFERQLGEEIKPQRETPCSRRFFRFTLHEGCSLATKTVRRVLYPSGRDPG